MLQSYKKVKVLFNLVLTVACLLYYGTFFDPWGKQYYEQAFTFFIFSYDVPGHSIQTG